MTDQDMIGHMDKAAELVAAALLHDLEPPTISYLMAAKLHIDVALMHARETLAKDAPQ